MANRTVEAGGPPGPLAPGTDELAIALRVVAVVGALVALSAVVSYAPDAMNPHPMSDPSIRGPLWNTLTLGVGFAVASWLASMRYAPRAVRITACCATVATGAAGVAYALVSLRAWSFGM